MNHRNPDTWTPEFAREIERAREYVATLHAELPRWGLVVWTAGNVSQRVRGAAEDGSQDLLVIKPSGVSYDDRVPRRWSCVTSTETLCWGRALRPRTPPHMPTSIVT